MSSQPITHLHIRCTSVDSDVLWIGNIGDVHSKNTTITSFIFDLACGMENRNNLIVSRRPPYSILFNLPMSFIASLINIRLVRLVVNREQLQIFLPVNQWQQVIRECLQLDRVIIQLADSGEFTQDALHIEGTLRLSRPGIIFRIINV